MSASFLRAQRVAFSYAGGEPVLSDVEFQLVPGWTGVVGPNGAGKTTLLRLISGELAPDSGVLQVARPAVVCAQTLDSVEAPLSPGERKRLQIASALAASPATLLMDEPANHLDARSREWLVRELYKFDGVGLLVSHDRSLLDSLTSRTLRVANGTARLYAGSFSQARLAWEREERERRDLRESLSAQEKKLKAQLASARQGRKAPKRKHDSESRSITAKNLAGWADKKKGRTIEVARRAYEKAAEATRAVKVSHDFGGAVFAWFERCPRPWIARLPDRAFSRDDRVWLRGPNGSGKTTLLKRLLAVAPTEVLYLPQDLAAAEARDILYKLRGLPRVLQMAALLGLDPSRLLASQDPSPGEARKLLLAHGLATNAYALFLDEPTNHLDLPSIERLEKALRDYPGAILLATHDEALARAVTSTIWQL